MSACYQDQAIQDYNDAAEAKGNDPIPTMEQIDEYRVLIRVEPHYNHIGECLWGCCA